MTAITGNKPPAPAKTRSLTVRTRNNKIVLPTADGLRFEQVDNIRYLEAAGNYTFLHFKDDTKLLVCRTLQELQKRLPQQRFLRIHRSYLINADYLIRYVRGKGGYVILEGNTHLNVSAGRRQDFLERVGWIFR